MLYKYEMHVHDSLCSRRGYNPPEVIAKVYYDRGYAGMCFTNHFLQGSTAIDKTLPWEDKVRAYWNAYLRVKDWAKDKDFDILFGLEHHYGLRQRGAHLRHQSRFSARTPEYRRRAHQRLL